MNLPSGYKRLLSARRETSPPPLLLNDHCQICEFQQRCRKQAIDESNLSLLKGMTVNEIAKYNARGLFTVTQLSYTFRSRRRPKRARAAPSPHYFSLQAQALREKKIFIHGAMNFKIGEPRVYFDIEGTPETRSNYLIGASFVEHGKEEFASFWAGQDDERQGKYFQSSCATFSFSTVSCCSLWQLRDIRVAAGKASLAARAWPSFKGGDRSITNLLSVIRTRVYFPTYSNSLKEIGGFLGARWTGGMSLRHPHIGLEGEMARSGDPNVAGAVATVQQRRLLRIEASCRMPRRAGR